jgi:hypothetical protein
LLLSEVFFVDDPSIFYNISIENMNFPGSIN